MVGRATLALALSYRTIAEGPLDHYRGTIADAPLDDIVRHLFRTTDHIIRHLFRTHNHGHDASRSRSIAHDRAALYYADTQKGSIAVTTITSTTHPALWSFVQLVRATMNVLTSCEVKTLLTRDDLDRYEAAMIELSTRDLLVLAGVIDDETRFDELRGSAAHQVAALLA